MKIKYGLSIIVGLVLLAFQCEKKEIYCTEEYRMLTVEVLDKLGAPVSVDEYLIVSQASGDTLIISEGVTDDFLGTIVIFEDKHLPFTSKKGKNFVLTVYQNNQLIATEKYLIAHDDCHVLLKSGKTQIRIE